MAKLLTFSYSCVAERFGVCFVQVIEGFGKIFHIGKNQNVIDVTLIYDEWSDKTVYLFSIHSKEDTCCYESKEHDRNAINLFV